MTVGRGGDEHSVRVDPRPRRARAMGGGQGVARTEIEELLGPFDAPAFPASVVPRRRLVERLDAAVRGKLTIVVAPAGWGKSVLLAQGARTRRDRVAWLAPRPDHDARTFT